MIKDSWYVIIEDTINRYIDDDGEVYISPNLGMAGRKANYLNTPLAADRRLWVPISVRNFRKLLSWKIENNM